MVPAGGGKRGLASRPTRLGIEMFPLYGPQQQFCYAIRVTPVTIPWSSKADARCIRNSRGDRSRRSCRMANQRRERGAGTGGTCPSLPYPLRIFAPVTVTVTSEQQIQACHWSPPDRASSRAWARKAPCTSPRPPVKAGACPGSGTEPGHRTCRSSSAGRARHS